MKSVTMGKLLFFVLKHKLIVSIIIGVAIGITCGMSFKLSGKSWSEREIMYIKFPGELFLRLVNCLILPLVTSSIISATCNLTRSGRIGLMALYYYLTTTTIGITLCVVLVQTIRPGEVTRVENVTMPVFTRTSMTIDTILDLIRNVIPENIIDACMYQYQTVLEQPPNASAVPIEEWIITSKYVNGTNVLGLVFHSLLLGVAIGQLEMEEGKPLSNFCTSFADTMLIIMKWITKAAPVAVPFLIAGRILEIEDFGNTLSHLGFYVLTVFIGLITQGFIILPLLHWIITRKSSYKIISKLGPSFAAAIGTSSSTATVPHTIRSLESLGINSEVTKFLVPIGAALNLDGIALYESVGAIFIIQLRGLQFPLFKIIIISITCTLSCVGSAGIPSGGYMMLIMVLNSLDVPVEDVTLIIAIDWLVDRFRTAINIIGDALGASIITQFYEIALEKEKTRRLESIEKAICKTRT
ncbi:excitatory amino acid transporter 3-like [Pseudomyrmex gracilis]|uniref:excitatory amino acid transporter 3-like n=1 Tax=Pseudomyrmex gracilis TaxID=219809 RepID=UPI0009952718|nr:excitatory amino acid transporter 3-like [Pseudomyrmex gracilis]